MAFGDKTVRANPDLQTDVEMAQRLEEAALALAKLMTEADKMAINFSFSGIQKNARGVFEVQNIAITKRLGT